MNAIFKQSWITDGADKDLPVFAEEAGKELAKNGLSNSKFRSIYGELKRIQFGGFDKGKASFWLLRPKVAYARGRDRNNKGLKLFEEIFNKAYGHVNGQRSFDNFCNLMEAILAYLRAYEK